MTIITFKKICLVSICIILILLPFLSDHALCWGLIVKDQYQWWVPLIWTQFSSTHETEQQNTIQVSRSLYAWLPSISFQFHVFTHISDWDDCVPLEMHKTKSVSNLFILLTRMCSFSLKERWWVTLLNFSASKALTLFTSDHFQCPHKPGFERYLPS